MIFNADFFLVRNLIQERSQLLLRAVFSRGEWRIHQPPIARVMLLHPIRPLSQEKSFILFYTTSVENDARSPLHIVLADLGRITSRVFVDNKEPMIHHVNTEELRFCRVVRDSLLDTLFSSEYDVLECDMFPTHYNESMQCTCRDKCPSLRRQLSIA